MLVGPDVLKDIPPSAGLEVRVKLPDVALRVRNAAQAENGHDAVQALAGHTARPLEIFDTDRNDLVSVL